MFGWFLDRILPMRYWIVKVKLANGNYVYLHSASRVKPMRVLKEFSSLEDAYKQAEKLNLKNFNANSIDKKRSLDL